LEDLYSGDMHLCGAFDIILALLFPAQAPPSPGAPWASSLSMGLLWLRAA